MHSQHTHIPEGEPLVPSLHALCSLKRMWACIYCRSGTVHECRAVEHHKDHPKKHPKEDDDS